jgi:hypothetical protein
MMDATRVCGAARLSVIATLLVMTTGVACGRAGKPIGIPLRTKTQFQSEWKRYLTLPEEKSLAVAGDLDGVYASGIAQRAASTETAIADAQWRTPPAARPSRVEEAGRGGTGFGKRRFVLPMVRG